MYEAPPKAESTDDPQMQIKSLPSSELSSLHSEVDPSLLPISLGGEQEDKVRIIQDHQDDKLRIILGRFCAPVMKFQNREETPLGWWLHGKETQITKKRSARCFLINYELLTTAVSHCTMLLSIEIRERKIVKSKWMDFAHFSTKYDFLVSTLVKLQIFIPKNVKLTHNSTPDVMI